MGARRLENWCFEGKRCFEGKPIMLTPKGLAMGWLIPLQNIRESFDDMDLAYLVTKAFSIYDSSERYVPKEQSENLSKDKYAEKQHSIEKKVGQK